MTPLVLVLVVVGATAALMLAHLGSLVASAERARATADVVALSAVTGGDDAATEVARANEASLTSIRRSGPLVVVRIERAGNSATAAAQPAQR